MRKLPSRKLLAALIAGALFVPHTGFTLGLGEIEVNSALNQRLKADIELLSTTPEDAENIIVKLASRKEFTRAGLDRPYLLNDLRFKSEVIDGVAYIKVSSGSPIREPFINFLIELDWPNGHLLREYTVLLDPPVFMTQSASTTSVQSTDNSGFRPAVTPAVTPVVTASSAPAVQSAPNSTSSAPTFIPAPVVQQQTPTRQPVTSYRVKSGDTAWSLADAMRPNQDITVPQMLMAMLRTNPESFIDGNVNGLKRGYILRAPDAAQITSISPREAHAMVREHWALWREYQQSQAGNQAVSAMPAAGETVSTDGDTSSVADVTGVKDDARLAIVAGTNATSTVGGKDPVEMSAQELRAELALARERVETERVEKEELKQRVETLEQRAIEMQGLLSIEDNELSAVQSLNLPAVDNAVDTKDGSEAGDEVLEEVLSETEANDIADGSEVVPAESAPEELVSNAEDPANEAVPEDAIFTDEVSAQTADTNQSEDAAAMPEDAEAVVDTAASEAADPLTLLLNNPTLLAAAGGGLLLFVALIALINRSRKKRADSAAYAVPVTTSATDIESLADDIAEETATAEVNEEVNTESQVAAEEASAVADETVTEEVVDEQPLETEPRDDVIAEADVYLAYGIYQQAEDLLKQALEEHPENDSYRVKLAETYYTSKNADAFLEVASELKQRIDDDSPLWNKVKEMGQSLCADDPMFQGAMIDDLNSDASTSNELSVDFGLEEDVVSDDDLDAGLNLDSESLELAEMGADEDAVVEDEIDISENLIEPIDEIEFDLSDTGAVEEETDSEDEFSLDIDASELDIEIHDGSTNDTGTEEESSDLGDIEISLDEADTPVSDADLDAAVEKMQTEESETEAFEEVLLDLSEEVDAESDAESQEMDLAETAGTVTAANDGAAEDDEFDLSGLDGIDEISTKLDLARAYLDMGDHDGTRDILDEVLVDGNDEQKQEANDLMQKLG